MLITVSRAKQGIPNATNSDDARLEVLILAASNAIETFSRRTFALAEYVEWVSHSHRELALPNYPVQAVQRISERRGPALFLQNTGPNQETAASARVTATGLVLLRTAAGVETSNSSVTWAGAPTLASLASAISALGNGWLASTVDGWQHFPSADLQILPVARSCLHIPLGLYLFVELRSGEFQLDAEAGILRGPFPSHAPLRIQYSAGFATIPEEVQLACEFLVHLWFQESQRDPTLRTEWDADSGTRWQEPAVFPVEVQRLLQPYRR